MAALRDIRRRIKSVKNTAQITKAMQMVAASKMRRAQDQALAGRPYAEQMDKMLRSLSRRAGRLEHPLWNSRPQKTPCALLITTDKGLCGGLNTNLLREAAGLPRETVFVSVGRKGKQFLARSGRNLLADFEIAEKAGFGEVKQVSKFLIDKFLAREVDSLSVLYPKFINTLVQKSQKLQVLPIQDLANTDPGLLAGKSHAQQEANPVEHLYEPDVETLLSELLPAYVHFQVYHMLLEARASEHSARMVAMKTATDNASQLVKELTLEYNKARQAAITNEILEISSAQMAAE
ncbi:MAG: ATP synthase F1 subunit gamma [Methylacidiphilales bacterium]|nr:ATP synthase F1 subunit gamma [Candidatus Methylacidiphilales bacterium]